jgi:hypothetical protein
LPSGCLGGYQYLAVEFTKIDHLQALVIDLTLLDNAQAGSAFSLMIA